MQPEMKVSFTLTTDQDLDPGKITDSLGITPTKTWRMGDLIHPKAGVRCKHNGWRITTGNRKGYYADQLLLEVINVIRPHIQAIRELCDTLNLYAELSCVAYIADVTPGIHFTQDILRDLAALNAAIDIDLMLTEADGDDENAGAT